MDNLELGRIAKYPDNGDYWSVEGQPVHFNPPALTFDRVRLHYPDAEQAACKRLSGKQWWALVKLLEGA